MELHDKIPPRHGPYEIMKRDVIHGTVLFQMMSGYKVCERYRTCLAIDLKE